jgi:hypothetical protein
MMTDQIEGFRRVPKLVCVSFVLEQIGEGVYQAARLVLQTSGNCVYQT